MGVQVIGAEAVAAKFAKAANQLAAEKPIWLPQVGEMLQLSIQKNILRQGLERTGALFYSGRTFNQTANGITVGFGKDVEYAQALEFGARPHEIAAGTNTKAVFGGGVGNYRFYAPSGRGLLSFWWENAGMYFVGPRVSHPGNKPYRYVYHGTLEAFYPIVTFFSKRIRYILGGV